MIKCGEFAAARKAPSLTKPAQTFHHNARAVALGRIAQRPRPPRRSPGRRAALTSRKRESAQDLRYYLANGIKIKALAGSA